jgi:glycosyltransferase involved in cell wall biosynthesis
MMGHNGNEPLVTVVIKAFNEEKNIGACIDSVVHATQGISAQIILADSCSTDRTVELSRRPNVMVVRLAHPHERSCGVGGQLGFQFADGQFLLLIDGDMILCPGFIEAALVKLSEYPRLAGVGGRLIERTSRMEYQLRMKRPDPSYIIGDVPFLSGGGLYRMEAIRDVGYFTNRNLHSCEEFELGIRLRSRGWTMARIPVTSVEHSGHINSSWRLLVQRYRTRYCCGFGELLRSALGKPFLGAAFRKAAPLLLVIIWWIAIIGLLVSWTSCGSSLAGVFCVSVLIVPMAYLLARKNNLRVAAYTFALWNLYALALFIGFFAKQADPASQIDAEIID